MTKRAATLLPSQLRHLLRVTEATSRHPERDVLILWLGFGAGLRVTEIARITVADVMLPSGKLRGEISLRSAITKGSRQRLAYLTNPKLIAAMERFVTWRKAKDFGCSLDASQYRGLMPQTALVTTWKGGAYELTTKRLRNQAGEVVEYQSADSLLTYIKGLYRAAGLGAQCSSHSGRRTFGSRVIAAGESMEVLQMLLGHASIDVTAVYVDVDPRRLSEMFATVI